MYYLINVIKDLQIQISNINNSCSINPNNPNSSNNPNNANNKIDTIDVKMKKDFISLLDYIKNYFI